MSNQQKKRWTAADVDAAAAEPKEGWEASDRSEVPPEAVSEAKALLRLLDDTMPDVVDWDAHGGIWLEWTSPGLNLSVSVFKTITILIADYGSKHESYRSTITQETADGVRSVLWLHELEQKRKREQEKETS